MKFISAVLVTCIALAARPAAGMLTIPCDNSRRSESISKLGGYWPLSTEFPIGEDKSGNNFHLTNQLVETQSSDPSSPLKDGYAYFNNPPDSSTTSTANMQFLHTTDFDPRTDSEGKDFTWEFWWNPEGSRKDVSGCVGCNGKQWRAHWPVSFGGATNSFYISSGVGDSNGGHCTVRDVGSIDGPKSGQGKGSCESNGQWKHFAFVHDNAEGKVRIYHNSVEIAHRDFEPGPSTTIPSGAAVLALGGEQDSNTPPNGMDWDQLLHGKMTEVRFWNEARSKAQLMQYMNTRLYDVPCDGAGCSDIAYGGICNETQSKTCHKLANCEVFNGAQECFCEMGLIGDGVGENGCVAEGWTIRVVYEDIDGSDLDWLYCPAERQLKYDALKACANADAVQFQRGVFPFSDANHFPYQTNALLVNFLFESEPSASAVENFDAAACFPAGTIGDTGKRLYTWVYGVTDKAQSILPTGLTLNGVSFQTNCSNSGCWVLDVTYTTGGPEAFNSFYLPKAEGDDALSYDFPYDSNTINTFQPRNFPCRSTDYIAADGEVPSSLPTQVTTCCLSDGYVPITATVPTDTTGGFLADYRPTMGFVNWVTTFSVGKLCSGTGFPEVVDRANYNETEDNVPGYTSLDFPSTNTVPHHFLDGKFRGMPVSPGVVSTETLDPFFYQYRAIIKLDEVELRQNAGRLSGTVGVEHTVDTFLGYVNFRPTGKAVLDSMATQVNIHLEKTNFFSVSTHGTNDYTFLEYVNMRLISIYTEDIIFSGAAEQANRTVRTDSTGNANYVQVTFTMNAQYRPNLDSGGLIPLDSVRAGRGTFFASTELQHLCSDYSATGATDIGLTVDGTSYVGTISDFDYMLKQDCGPQSVMCVSPTTVPDQFVSFNIPLGFEVFDGQASNSLDNNIFVSMVINALDKGPYAGTAPNEGQNPMQMKTTLDASIPIVAGGINIFCDGITAKTDLKDVANADIIVGSAVSKSELTRLRIIKDVANTNLGATPSAEVDSDSIEAGLMTLVLKGNSSYFENGVVNSQGYSLELDDLITIHLMTDGEAPSESNAECAAASAPKSVDCQVRDLLSEAPEDNTDTNGLDTDGYKLNGAFKMDVKRGQGIALLEPTPELLAICPFNPTRPTGGLLLESCITRRDVRSRTYPVRQGAGGPTAMELLAQTDDLVSDSLTNEIAALEAQKLSTPECTCSAGDDTATPADECCEAGFMQMILGENSYARDLGVDYVQAIHEAYELNGRYTRAYWINPGYEWTPTQTAGKSIFSVSQKVYLFALITLDENISRRRMLLSTDVNPTKDTGSGVGGAQVLFPVARTSIMAQAFDVPDDRVVLFNVEMQLTPDEACLSDQDFVARTRATFVDYLDTAASSFYSVQVLGFSRNLNGVACRRALRKLLAEFSDATSMVQMMIVYKDEGEAVFNDVAFADMPGITSVAIDASSSANVKVDASYKKAVPNSKKDKSSKGDSDEGGDSNTGLIAGIAGGVGGAVLLLVGGLLFMRSRNSQMHVAEPVQTINVADLKSQLADNV